ncbi:MAG: hypothetical protein WCO64_08170 [Actinomycetes bacterium]
MPGWLSKFMNVPATYIHFTSWLQISVANLIVILVMIALFTIALLTPFPGSNAKGSHKSGDHK